MSTRIHPTGMSITQTVITLSAATDAPLVAFNPNRKYLAVANIGTGLVTLNFDAAAVAGSGWPLAAAAGAGQQGGEMVWEASCVPTQAVHGISTAGSTVVVLEGV